MCYYAVNNHQYLIKDTKKIKSLVEKAKDQKNITFDTPILEKKEIENIYLYEMLENIPITELTNYKNKDSLLVYGGPREVRYTTSYIKMI